ARTRAERKPGAAVGRDDGPDGCRVGGGAAAGPVRAGRDARARGRARRRTRRGTDAGRLAGELSLAAECGRASGRTPVTALIRVALVDDQAIVRAGLARILSPADGFEVVAECADGRQAVEELPVLHPDVVLMDIRMPVLDGIAATAQLRAATDPL